ncbi:helix-turn-helix domain-containing protein [Kitasatospora sp. NPDC051914]|uniref:helix-turn-helix transcriptional regulator n=1 Tax=Kitasatospora sp. NPDC051914 TaxID=3154945 RepID=UPI003436DF52
MVKDPLDPAGPTIDEAALALYQWTLVNGPLTERLLPRAASETGLTEAACLAALQTLTAARLLKPADAAAAAETAWQAENPQAASAQLLSDQEAALRVREEELRSKREQLQSLRDEFAALVPVYLQGRQHAHPHGTIDLVTDKFAVRAMLVDAVGASRTEVLVSKPGGAFPPGAMREALPRDLELLRSGVRMRNLYQHTTRFDPATRANAEQLIAAGAEIRTLTDTLPQMIIVDRELAFLPAGPGGALLIREPSLLAFLIKTFERDWETAFPFSIGPRAAREISEDLKQNIVVLLANGLKDEAIARRLGVSLRTCRRHVSELLETLGAQSRFQAGAIAERLNLTSVLSADGDQQLGSPLEGSAGCAQCGRALPPSSSTGRPRRYCSPRCRSRAHRAQQRDNPAAE